MVDNHINAAKMICRFYYIVYVQYFFLYADCIRLKNVSGLIMSETTPLHMIGVICQVNLRFMVNPARIFSCFFVSKYV